MATKAKPNKTKKEQHTPDYYPVQRTIELGVDGGSFSSGTPAVGDMGKLLSIRNRRLYRYGMKYQIKVDLQTRETTASPYSFEVYALSNNWDVQRAFALAKETYDEAYSDEKQKSGVVPGRWRDFRVFHGISGALVLDPMVHVQTTLLPTPENNGEHPVSSVDVNGTDTEFSWTSAGGRLNILNEWANAGRAAQRPTNKSVAAPYDGVNADDLSNSEFSNLQTDGDNPPYNIVTNPNQWVRVGTLRVDATTGLQRLSTGYFDAPCGVFVVVNTSTSGSDMANSIVTVTAKSGDYKGVLAEKMCQEE